MLEAAGWHVHSAKHARQVAHLPEARWSLGLRTDPDRSQRLTGGSAVDAGRDPLREGVPAIRLSAAGQVSRMEDARCQLLAEGDGWRLARGRSVRLRLP